MMSRCIVSMIGLPLMLWPVATFAEATPYPPHQGAVPSESYKVTVNGQPVFVHKFLTFNQFNWMDYASFSMTGKVRVEVTLLVSERRVHTAEVRPIAYGIKPQINGNTITFELDRPRYLVLFLNGQSQGRKTMKKNSHLEWKVKYVSGTLLARGYKGGREILTEKVETTGAPGTRPRRWAVDKGIRLVSRIRQPPLPQNDRLQMLAATGAPRSETAPFPLMNT